MRAVNGGKFALGPVRQASKVPSFSLLARPTLSWALSIRTRSFSSTPTESTDSNGTSTEWTNLTWRNEQTRWLSKFLGTDSSSTVDVSTPTDVPTGGEERTTKLKEEATRKHLASLVDLEAIAQHNREDSGKVPRNAPGSVKVPLGELLTLTGRHGNRILGQPPIGRFGKGAEKDSYVASLEEKMMSENLSDQVIAEEGLVDFDYWRLFPSQVREWLKTSRIPVGTYDEQGWWVPNFPAWKSKLYQHFQAIEKPDSPESFRAGAALKTILPEKFQHAWAQELPSDLVGQYRFGIQEEELEAVKAPLKLRRILSFQYASHREIYKFRCEQNAKKFGRFPEDTGRTEVILANMHRKIEALQFHMKNHHKDQQTRYGLQKLIRRRLRLMHYLKNKDSERYYTLILGLNMPDIGKIRIKGREVRMKAEPRRHHNR